MSDLEKRISILKKIFDGCQSSAIIGEDIIMLALVTKKNIGIITEKMHVNREEDITLGIIDLTKENSQQALMSLLRNKEYSQEALKYFKRLNIESIKVVQELWRVYEEEHKFIHPIDLLNILAKIEGQESKAFKILFEEKKYNRLWGEQLEIFDKLCLDFQIEEKFHQLKEDAEIIGKKDFVLSLEELQKHVDERIGKTVGLFDKAIEEQDLLVTKERKEGLQKQVDLTQKSIDRTHSMTRNFLIIISILIGVITGTFIWLLVEVWNYLAST